MKAEEHARCEAIVGYPHREHSDLYHRIAAALTLAQQEARAAALEEAARMAETWGNAPPNPRGRRAALAAGIRALLEGK